MRRLALTTRTFLLQHMMMQLEILTDWTEWVVQRVGVPGGPPSSEYEITEAELDWCVSAPSCRSFTWSKSKVRIVD
jgi:hypothetical protein